MNNPCTTTSAATANRHLRTTPPGAYRAYFVLVLLVMVAALGPPGRAQEERKIVIDEDSAGPGGTGMQAILALVNSSATKVLGITVVTGDGWRDEEVAHSLRLLEIIGRTDIPVVPGAVFPLVNSLQAVAEWEKRYGKVPYQGAWNYGHPVHTPSQIPPMPEGFPTTKAAKEDAPHFLVRMVRLYPGKVTVYAGGPLTNLALAQALDPHFASLAKELILMGGSIHPKTSDPEFAASPHREFNFWMDPEAAHRVLGSRWRRIIATTLDISLKTRMDKSIIATIAHGTTPAAKYVAKYAQEDYMWDELAAVAWLDPGVITRSVRLHLDVSTDHGPTYGDTVALERDPVLDRNVTTAYVQLDLDVARFYRDFEDLIMRPTPPAGGPIEERNSDAGRIQRNR